MTEYINASELKKILLDPPLHNSLGGMCMQDVIDIINDCKIVDVDPVVHAHWEYDENTNDWGIGGWCCSNCGFKNDILGTSRTLHSPINMHAGTHYCGQCGAIMDEEEE